MCQSQVDRSVQTLWVCLILALVLLVPVRGIGTTEEVGEECVEEVLSGGSSSIPITRRFERWGISSGQFKERARKLIDYIRRETRKERYIQVTEESLWSYRISTPNGQYIVQLSDDSRIDPNSLGKVVAHVVPLEGGRFEGMVSLHPTWIQSENAMERNWEDLSGLVRTLIRADVTHPHRRYGMAQGVHAHPSLVQQKVHRELKKLHEVALIDDAGRPPRIGLQAPGGIGKTLMSARYAREVVKPDVVIFTVNDVAILDGTVATYCRELDLDPNTQVQRLYGSGANAAIGRNTKLVLATRQTALRRLNDLDTFTNGKTVLWVFDEAHHAGLLMRDSSRNIVGGEYRRIISHLNGKRQNANDPKIFMFMMSATMWHEDDDIITNRDFLGYADQQNGHDAGKVYAPFLTDEQLIRLERGQNPEEAARIQLFRAMYQGYLTPIYTAELVSARVAQTQVRGEAPNAISLSEREVTGGRTLVIPEELLTELRDQITSMRVDNMVDRYVIVVHQTARANAYRDGLRRLFQELGEDSEFQALHSGPGGDRNALDWIRDEGDFNSDEERAKHKYLLVDRMVNEGVDVPGFNGVIILRGMNSQASASIRILLQIITRTSRISSNTHSRAADFSATIQALANELNLVRRSSQPNVGERRRSTIGARVDEVPLRIEQDHINFIQPQEAIDLQFADDADLWLLGLAPFVDKAGDNLSRLAVKLFEMIHHMPRRTQQGVDDTFLIEERQIQSIESRWIRDAFREQGNSILNIYRQMRSIHADYTEALQENWPTREQEQVLHEARTTAHYKPQVESHWFELKEILRDHFDEFKDLPVLLALAPRHEANDVPGTRSLRSFYGEIFEHISKLRDPRESNSNREEVRAGRVRVQDNDTVEMVITGPNAYSYLATELGVHTTVARDGGNSTRTRKVDVRVTPLLDARGPLLSQIQAHQDTVLRTEVRRIRTFRSRDRVAVGEGVHAYRIALRRGFQDGGEINLRRNTHSDWELVLRRNQDVFFSMVVEQQLITALRFRN